MSLLSKRLGAVPASPTLAMTAKAAALKAQGINVLSLSAGEPDFPTPAWVQEAAITAMQRGETKYTAVEGTKALKTAVQSKFSKENGLSYSLNEIIVTSGAKQAIAEALSASLDPDDEVLIPAPYWVSYPTMVEIAGGKPVIITPQSGFKITASELEAAITPKTKWLIVNSPSNPSGALYTGEEFAALGAVLEKYPHVHVLSDEIYEHLVYDGAHMASFAAACPQLKERTLTVNGVSKAYAMTGWRIGYAAGPKALIDAMSNLQSQSTSNACSISQAAAVAALEGPQDFLRDWCADFQKRRDLCVTAIQNIPGLQVSAPAGAFYLYVNCAELTGKATPAGKKLETDSDFCLYLLEEAHLATVAGDAFGLSPYIRLSYATSESILHDACGRLHEACIALR